jgi:hypothetical protein
VFAQGVPALENSSGKSSATTCRSMLSSRSSKRRKRHGVVGGDGVHLGFQKLQVAVKMVQAELMRQSNSLGIQASIRTAMPRIGTTA